MKTVQLQAINLFTVDELAAELHQRADRSMLIQLDFDGNLSISFGEDEPQRLRGYKYILSHLLAEWDEVVK